MATAVSTIILPEKTQLSTKLCGYQSEGEHEHEQLHSIFSQQALLLKAVKEEYTLIKDHAVPKLLHPDEILIRVAAVGLNPVDWKAPAFNFGIPDLPWVFGRDFAGTVVKTSHHLSNRIQVGDVVLVPSTDYRDIRKAAFQEYAVATLHNTAKIPQSISLYEGASIGVAYVAAALALGVCFGVDFSKATTTPGPNLVHILQGSDRKMIPEDIAGECFSEGEMQQAKHGDWIAIWGASTTTGYITLQLARQCGLRVICVADIARHGRKLQEAGADVLVDRHDPERAIEIIRGVTGGCLHYALDMVGRETATVLREALCTGPDSPPAHLLGLTGLPKGRHQRIRYHAVPIKLFHLCVPVAEGLMRWLECLLEKRALVPPELIVRKDGLAGVNDALAMLRDGSASGRRVVVELERSGS
ncbi:zinc-binding alcohol dehydrogenase family protein [Aspergillus stella-maris]|uniref:zinc-binding alcohol dehydrogenase family protein n=1 Tax=Aspergillus stella-maris TaxID=1810926 RepID=UPI003CCD267A